MSSARSRRYWPRGRESDQRGRIGRNPTPPTYLAVALAKAEAYVAASSMSFPKHTLRARQSEATAAVQRAPSRGGIPIRAGLWAFVARLSVDLICGLNPPVLAAHTSYLAVTR